MSVIDDLITEVRALRKEVAGLKQSQLRTLMPATVKSVGGARVVATLADDGEDGPVDTPALRMAAPTGARGGGVSRFTRYGVGDPVLVVSPSGDVTTASAIMPWVDTKQDPAPGSAETDGEAIVVGNARLDIKDRMIRLTVGTASYVFSPSGLTSTKTIEVTEGDIINRGKSVGATHLHTGVVPGGGNTGEPV